MKNEIHDPLASEVSSDKDDPGSANDLVGLSRVSSEGVAVVDIGKVIIQLSSEVAQAKLETERERSLRVSYEAQIQHLSERVAYYENRAAGSSTILPNKPDDRVSISIDETGDVSLEKCVQFIASLPPHMQEAVIMAWSPSGPVMMENIILSDVLTILRPVDCPGLLFLVMDECEAMSAPNGPLEYCEITPFSMDNLYNLLGYTCEEGQMVNFASQGT